MDFTTLLLVKRLSIWALFGSVVTLWCNVTAERKQIKISPFWNEVSWFSTYNTGQKKQAKVSKCCRVINGEQFNAYQNRIGGSVTELQRLEFCMSRMRNPVICDPLSKILICHKILLKHKVKLRVPIKKFTHVCIVSVQGEITLQSAKSIYHRTPQFIRS